MVLDLACRGAAYLIQNLTHQARPFGNHRQQHLRGADQVPPSVFPVEQGALCHSDGAGEFDLGEAGRGAVGITDLPKTWSAP